MPNRCPKCGSELTYFNRGGELVFDCHYDPKDCRIAALEKELGETKADVTSRRALIKEVADMALACGYSTADGSVIEWIFKQRGELLEALACNRGLAADQQPLIDDLQSAYSERDAALAQVVALREEVKHDEMCKVHFPEAYCDCGVSELLSNTSATAQQFVANIKREALEEVIAFVCNDEQDIQLLTPEIIRAAILCEKEKG